MQTFPFGLSDCDGEAAINIYSSSVLASTCEESPIITPQSEAFVERQSIQLRTLDSFCQEQSIEKIDLLKTDTEGADLRTINGATQMLSEKRIGFIVFEFYCPDSQSSSAGTLFPINAVLNQFGYRLISFYTDFVSESNSVGVYNALYMVQP